MLDRTIRICASWDWVTPVITWCQDWRHRPSTGFFLPYGHSYSAWEIKNILKGNGIKVWGTMVIGDTITFRVRVAQAIYTKYCLERLGIPFECGLSSGVLEQHRTANSSPELPTKMTAPRTGFGFSTVQDYIDDFIDQLAAILSAELE